MRYYEDVQFIAAVDEADTVQRKVERWEAHRTHILHRALTAAVFVGDMILLQHRKHPVFDGVFDATISSHQMFTNDHLEDDEGTLVRMLDRELGLKTSDLLKPPRQTGSILYEAQDPQSEYSEHELCHVYTCHVSSVPKINMDVAYGFTLQPLEKLKKKDHLLSPALAPWVHQMFVHRVL